MAPLCLEKAIIGLTPRHLELIRTAGEAYRRLFEISATGPEWAPAYRAWCDAAENLAVAIVKQMEVRQ